ncbi:MAG: hypothetical protein C0404_01925 [Verrucomicrobia bacterium]|nr:hypothetical protein [Verrucomicrobiota bacterium]
MVVRVLTFWAWGVVMACGGHGLYSILRMWNRLNNTELELGRQIGAIDYIFIEFHVHQAWNLIIINSLVLVTATIMAVRSGREILALHRKMRHEKGHLSKQGER